MPQRSVRSQLGACRSRVVVVARDITEQHEDAARATLLAQELDHRVRNMMTMLQAITRIAAGRSADFPSFIDSLEQRIHALARTQDMLCEGPHGTVDLRALICGELRPYDDGDRVELVGAAVAVPEPRASALGLAIHELTTNAIKYGALSGAGGRLRVSWECSGADLRIEWVEAGAPTDPPAASGFGSTLLEQLLADQLSIRRDWSRQGLHATIQIALPATGD